MATSVPDIRQTPGLLIALVPPLGPQSKRLPAFAYLKLQTGTELVVRTSTLEFLDAKRNILETHANGFALTPGTAYAGPYSARFSDEDPLFSTAVGIRWSFNDLVVETSLQERADSAFRVKYLPLQVPVNGDPHIVVTLVNHTPTVINIAESIRSAICWADNKPYPSLRGGHWDGGAGLNPGSSTTRHFSLDDFAGAPRSGRHEMSFEILGFKSAPTSVEWLSSHEGERRSDQH